MWSSTDEDEKLYFESNHNSIVAYDLFSSSSFQNNDIQFNSSELESNESAPIATLPPQDEISFRSPIVFTGTRLEILVFNAYRLGNSLFIYSFMQLAVFKQVEKLATRIGARFLNKYEPCVTHVIAKFDDTYRAALTLKYLLGVGSGKWILGLDWIDECLEQGRMVDEEPYEALDFVGDSVPFDCRVNGAPNKLFEDFELFCQGTFKNFPVEECEQLFQLYGALTKKNPDDFSSTRRHKLIVMEIKDIELSENFQKALYFYTHFKVTTVKFAWIMDCMISQKLFPIRKELAINHSDEVFSMMNFEGRLLD